MSTLTTPLNTVRVTDLVGVNLMLAELEQPVFEVSAIDIETNVVSDFYYRRIRTIQVGNREKQWVIDLLPFAQRSLPSDENPLMAMGGHFGTRLQGELLAVRNALRPFLMGDDHLKVGHGLDFEFETFIWNFGYGMDNVYDTLLAEKNLKAGLVRFTDKGYWGLEDLSRRYLNFELSKDLQTSFDLTTSLSDEQAEYCAFDVRIPVGIYQRQSQKVEKFGVEWALKIDCGALGPFAEAYVRGFRIDKEAWLNIIHNNEQRLTKIVAKLDTHFIRVVKSKHITEEDIAEEKRLHDDWFFCHKDVKKRTEEQAAERNSKLAALRTFRSGLTERRNLAEKCEGEAALNYGSPKQLEAVLRKLGYDIPDTDDGTLKKLSKFPNMTVDEAFEQSPELDYSVIDLLRLYRTVDKELGTYGYAWITPSDQEVKQRRGGRGKKKKTGHLHPVTGRIHSRVNVYGATTGRTSSTDPNLQNIPAESAFRRAFIANEGYVLITRDYSGCELRIIAELSKDKIWIQAFLNDWDVHSIVAEMLYGQRWLDATEDGCAYYAKKKKCKCKGHKTLRNNVKALNFGLAYGLGPRKLAEDLGIDEEEAFDLYKLYRLRMPVVTSKLDQMDEWSRTNLKARTLSGRLKYWHAPTREKAKELLAADGLDANDEKLVNKKLKALLSSIGREGKNMPVQGTNADIAKRAGYLIWIQIFRLFGAYIVNMVHDELVVECPIDRATECDAFLAKTMMAAGSEFVKLVPMTTEGEISHCWQKAA